MSAPKLSIDYFDGVWIANGYGPDFGRVYEWLVGRADIFRHFTGMRFRFLHGADEREFERQFAEFIA